MDTLVVTRVRSTGPLAPLTYLLVTLMGCAFSGGCLLLVAIGAPLSLAVLAAIVLVPALVVARYARWLWVNTRVEIQVDRNGIEVTNRKHSIRWAWHELSDVALITGLPSARPALALDRATPSDAAPSRYARLIRSVSGRLTGGVVVPVRDLDRGYRELIKAINERTDRLQVSYRRTLMSFIPDTSDVSSTSL